MNILLSRLVNKLAICPGGDSARLSCWRMRGVKVGQNVFIAQQVYFDELHPGGRNRGQCHDRPAHVDFFPFLLGAAAREEYAAVVIGRDVYVGPHCLILPGVRIGEGAVIKGGTVVSKNVPPGYFRLAQSESAGAGHGAPHVRARIPRNSLRG